MGEDSNADALQKSIGNCVFMLSQEQALTKTTVVTWTGKAVLPYWCSETKLKTHGQNFKIPNLLKIVKIW